MLESVFRSNYPKPAFETSSRERGCKCTKRQTEAPCRGISEAQDQARVVGNRACHVLVKGREACPVWWRAAQQIHERIRSTCCSG